MLDQSYLIQMEFRLLHPRFRLSLSLNFVVLLLILHKFEVLSILDYRFIFY